MITIGVIARGKYGLRLIENIKQHSKFEISSVELPDELPDFIETPADFIAGLNIDKTIFSKDLIIAYTLHPDLTPEIVRLAGRSGAHAVIIAGTPDRAGGKAEIEKLARNYSIKVQIHEICCNIEPCGDSIIDEYASCFGKPESSITIKDGIITNVKVNRCAPCGSTWHMAKGLIGQKIADAASLAGLLVQQYPCRAQRGRKGGIHKAAKLHKESIEKALKEVVR